MTRCYAISVPDDGGYKTQVKAVRQGFGSQPPLIEEEAPDIVGDEAYSIQEDKLKTEDDNRWVLCLFT